MEVHKKTDLILWEKLKKGSISALGELYDIYIEDLFSYGMQTSSDKEYVMDCIHDLFLDLYKYKYKLASTDNVKYYLLKALKRKINKKYNKKIISVASEYAVKNSCLQGNYAESYEEEIIALEYASERTSKLGNSLNFLTSRQKTGLFLRFAQERPYEEIAEIMNVSIQSSRTIIYRAIKALKQRLT
ncbi:MAG: sigma-70 family RNA polymerase sigma factor [Cellulophaga sp.]